MSFQERIPNVVYEFELKAADKRLQDFARAVFTSFRISPQEIIEEDKAKTIVLKVLSENAALIKNLNKVFLTLDVKGIQCSVRTLRPKDWLTVWKKGWMPAPLTEKLDIVPMWHKPKYKRKKGRDFIVLDTLLSFGTGLHETTQIVSQYIEDYAGRFSSFLDIGTGTGILALVAIKNGASFVRAIDIGSLSVEAAKHNFKVNGLEAEILKKDIRTYKDKRQYDFVAANLITADLIEGRTKIVGFVKPGGYLAISGISLDNLLKLRRAFKDQPLKCLKVNKRTQWSGLLFQKKMS